MVDTVSAARRETPPEPEHLVLAGGFPEVSEQEWVALVDGVVRRAGRIGVDAQPGAGVAALVHTTPDGILVAPLYTAAPDEQIGVPGTSPFVRGGTAAGAAPDGWDVRQRVAIADPAAAHDAVLAELETGASSVWLVVADPAALDTVLDGVFLDLAPVVLDTGGADTGAAEALLTLAHTRGIDPATLLGTLGLDPIGLRARTGSGPDVASVVPLAHRVAAEFPRVRALVVDGLPVHAAGGSDAQELGWSLAAGVAYLRALVDAGLAVDAAAGLLEFRLAATVEQFPTIAKLRAGRRVWARVLEASGAAPDTAPKQHAVTSPTLYTRRDPYVNLLRGTVAGFAAGIGGADAVTVAPFDAALGASTPFSRRIARNTQSLLIQEGHLARMIDPAGGSWFVESLTAVLARAAWAFFQEIEAAGGALAALDSGLIAGATAQVREARAKAVAHRKAPITGVSEFPDLHETPIERAVEPDGRPARSVNSASRKAQLAGTGGGGGLPVWRPAGGFEELRDRSDAVLAATGARPTAFLATLGPLAAHATRASFARSLLAAGGIDAVDAGPTASADAVVAAYAAGPATPLVVLCSADALYTERAADTAAALRAAGAQRILLAGRVEIPGVDGLLYAGCDVLAALRSCSALLEGTYA